MNFLCYTLNTSPKWVGIRHRICVCRKRAPTVHIEEASVRVVGKRTFMAKLEVPG